MIYSANLTKWTTIDFYCYETTKCCGNLLSFILLDWTI